jgi:hypothetical protein
VVTKKELEAGIFFIIDEVDRPDEKCIVQQIDSKIGKYIQPKLNKQYEFILKGKTERIPLQDFGITWVKKDNTFIFAKTAKSEATYKDGKPRRWQGIKLFTHKALPVYADEDYVDLPIKPKNVYVPLKCRLNIVAGRGMAIKAMRLPKKSTNDSIFHGDQLISMGKQDIALAKGLIKAGTDHAKFTRGVMAWLTLEMQTGFMIEFETYRHGVECLSTTSAMHGELLKLKGKELAEQKQRDLPNKVYTRSLVISYQALRAMYLARRNHRHPDWQIFCDFIEILPTFKYLIYPESANE